MRKTAILLLFLLMVTTCIQVPKPAHAQDDAMPVVFRDTLYGSLTGAFIGGLLLLTTENKSDHLEYIVYGGLAGAVGGLAYGVYDTSQALVEIDRGQITVGVPSIQRKTFTEHSRKRKTAYLAKVLRLHF